MDFFYGGFQMIQIMAFLIFFLAFGIIAFVFIHNISQWNKNNNSPRLSIDAMIITKRMSVSRHHHHHGSGHGVHTTSSTSYYVTFQVESGDRMELCVSGYDYGMLAEGDFGRLTFQGTRFLSFERR